MGNSLVALTSTGNPHNPPWDGWLWIGVAGVGVLAGHLLHSFLQQRRPGDSSTEVESAQSPIYKAAMTQNRRHSTKIRQLNVERCALEGQVRILQREMSQLRGQLRVHLYAGKDSPQLRTNTPSSSFSPANGTVAEGAPGRLMNQSPHGNSLQVPANSCTGSVAPPCSNESPPMSRTRTLSNECPQWSPRSQAFQARRPLLHLQGRKRTQKKCTQVEGIDVFTGNPVRQKTQPNSVITSGVGTPGPTPLETPVERNSDQIIRQMSTINTSLKPFTRLHHPGSGRMAENGDTNKLLSPLETYAPVSTPSCVSSSPMPTALGSPLPQSNRLSPMKQRTLTRFVFDEAC